MADVGRKALHQVEAFARGLLEQSMDPAKARELGRILSAGLWTHDHPLLPKEVEQLGLPVKVGVPPEDQALLDFYPHPRGRQSDVEYFPRPSVAAGAPARARGAAAEARPNPQKKRRRAEARRMDSAAEC